MFGWLGQILRVNLSSGAIRTEPLDRGMATAYLGGRGLGAYLCARGAPASAEPLSVAHNLVFATGPLTGTLAPHGGRYALITKGLRGGAITVASIGGSWGPELKFAGFDAIIFEGKAPEPVYLWITNGAAKLESAGHLCGKSVSDTTDLVRTETDQRAQVCCLEHSRENGGSYAVASGHSAAGAAGIGAVMGFKNLEAVAVYGTQGFRVAEPARFLETARKIRAKVAAKPVVSKGLKLEESVLVAHSVFEDVRSALECGGLTPPWNKAGQEHATAEHPAGLAGTSLEMAASSRRTPRRFAPSEGSEEPRPACESAMPRGCFGCSTAFSSFIVDSPANEVLHLTGTSDVVGAMPVLAQRLTLLQQTAEEHPLTDHSGCRVGGYTIVPRIIHHNDSSVSVTNHWRALTAVADSAPLCPFALAAINASDIAELLNAATGIDYSSDDIVRLGERVVKLWR